MRKKPNPLAITDTLKLQALAENILKTYGIIHEK